MSHSHSTKAEHSEAPSSRIATYSGVGAALAIAVATLWLGATGQLTLYINPNTVWFAVGMSVLVIVLVLVALIVPKHTHEHDDAHVIEPAFDLGMADAKHVDTGAGHGKTPRHARHVATPSDGHESTQPDTVVAHIHNGSERRPVRRIGTAIGAIAAFTLAAVAILLVPPSSLSAQAAQQRATTSLTSQLTSAQQRVLMGSDTSKFTVVDWANLIAAGASNDFVVGKRATMIGFIGADRKQSNTFALTRFVITCCALDAQPVSLTVVSNSSQSAIASGTWVQVTGTFVTHQTSSSGARTTVFRAAEVTPIKKPAQPYVF